MFIKLTSFNLYNIKQKYFACLPKTILCTVPCLSHKFLIYKLLSTTIISKNLTACNINQRSYSLEQLPFKCIGSNPSEVFPFGSVFENMRQICWEAPAQRCDFNTDALQQSVGITLLRELFRCQSAAYFQDNLK